jgi:two-component system, NtrC family, nitrogen regulation response regulator NtrX
MTENRKILVVDDEQDVRLYLSILLEDHGFTVVTAENGIEALQLAPVELPDLITLDITMPEQSGIKTYRYLKNDLRLQPIPVIIVTAVGDPIRSVLNEFGAFPEPEGFISKPVDQGELIALVFRLVGETHR